MKQNTKILLIALGLGLLSSLCDAQKLPVKLTITLTDKQVLRIDSAINAGASWNDSKSATQWYLKSFEPLYMDVRRQMDTVKTKKP